MSSKDTDLIIMCFVMVNVLFPAFLRCLMAKGMLSPTIKRNIGKILNPEKLKKPFITFPTQQIIKNRKRTGDRGNLSTNDGFLLIKH